MIFKIFSVTAVVPCSRLGSRCGSSDASASISTSAACSASLTTGASTANRGGGERGWRGDRGLCKGGKDRWISKNSYWSCSTVVVFGMCWRDLRARRRRRSVRDGGIDCIGRGLGDTSIHDCIGRWQVE